MSSPSSDAEGHGETPSLEQPSSAGPFLLQQTESQIVPTPEATTDQVVQQGRLHNSQIPIHKLPDEVLGEVLEQAVHDMWMETPKCPFRVCRGVISSVCNTWRSLMNRDTKFWSVIEVDEAPATVQTFLDKSKNHSLAVYTTRYWDGGSHSGMMLQALSLHTNAVSLNLVASHMSRVRSLELSVMIAAELEAILGQVAPKLQTLKLSALAHPNGTSYDLFQGHAPKLQTVALLEMPVRLDNMVLSGLKSLRIENPAIIGPTEAQLKALLERNPDLESLRLDLIQVEEQNLQGSPLFLGSLQHLSFNLTLDMATLLLRLIRFDKLESLCIKCSEFDEQPASVFLGPDHQYLVEDLRRLSTEASLIKFNFGLGRVGAGSICYSYDEYVPIAEVQISHPDTMINLDLLFDIVLPNVDLVDEDGSTTAEQPTAQVSLLFCDLFDMAGNAFRPILDRLCGTSIRRLTIGTGCRGGELLMKYLGQKEGSEWPLPDLVELSVEAGSSEMYLGLLLALQNRCAPEVEGSLERWPPRLELLDIRSLKDLPEEMEHALRECVSETGTFIRPMRKPVLGAQPPIHE